LSLEHMQQLRQFVECGATENATKGGHARIVLGTENSPNRHGCLEHGAKLIHLKGLAIFADTITAIQDRSPRIELDQQTNKRRKREHEQQTDTGKDKIDTALHHKSCLES